MKKGNQIKQLAEQITDMTQGVSIFVGEEEFEEDGDVYDEIFILDNGTPATDLWYKNAKVREKLNQIIDLIND